MLFRDLLSICDNKQTVQIFNKAGEPVKKNSVLVLWELDIHFDKVVLGQKVVDKELHVTLVI